MNKSAIFKAAHALTKIVNKTGDSYQVTFAAALRIIIAGSKYVVPANETRNKLVALQALDNFFAFATTKVVTTEKSATQMNAFVWFAQAMPVEFYSGLNLRTNNSDAGRQVLAAICKSIGASL